MAKKIAKPALKPKPKPTPKPTPKPLPRPKPAPLDLVRSPNFDAAMAQQDYANLMRDQKARVAAGLGQGGAPMTQSEIDKLYVDDGRGGRILNPAEAAKVKLQFDQLRANIAANQGPARNFDIDYIEGGQRNAQMTPTPSQMAAYNNLLQQQGAMASQYQNPQGQQQQMQSYQNFLNQGMNNISSVNQGAAESFANTQPGMPTTGSAQQFTANPAMPVAGMGAQKSRPTPRKFSTVNNPSARFA